MNEELRNKNNLIDSLLNQSSKQTDCITSLNHNNRLSNNVIDNINDNDDKLSHKNDPYAIENNHNNI